MNRIPFDRVNWVPSIFLIGTFALAAVLVPLYLWNFGLSFWQFAMFAFYSIATGISITLGYHRLFAHRAFEANSIVKAFTLIFGAASFEHSALDWVSDHRRHHKHVDHDDDPYDISKGFMWAHLGWMLFKLKPKQELDNVQDLKKDSLVMLQYNYWMPVGVVVGFVLPTVIGWTFGGGAGALGGLVLSGLLRVVFVQHCTFFINSLCHTMGSQPYSKKCSAKDSLLMAFFTFGEGYHNYHHEFQHDYRNGVKKWQFDPTKWAIWTLSKIGFTWNLRRVADDKIEAAEQAVKDLPDYKIEKREIKVG